MNTLISSTLLAVSLISVPVFAQQSDSRQEVVQFQKGSTHASLKGQIKGYERVDYQVRARAGQSMTVDFKPSKSSAYINVLPPESEEALFVGSVSGNHYEGALPTDGVYRVRVYLMRNAARRNEVAKYSLGISVKSGQ